VDQLAAFWDGVNREDIEIVERVQQGLDSTPFPGGRLCYRFEEPLHRFQNMVIDRLVGEPRVPDGGPAHTVPMFRGRARATTRRPSPARPPAA
jgi:choline monooxygenase